jgi:hypothetical protein
MQFDTDIPDIPATTFADKAGLPGFFGRMDRLKADYLH